jgi:hypothetical protein
MPISLPKDQNYSEFSFTLTDIRATFREVLACDSRGTIYHTDLNYSQTLKPYSKKLQS